MLKTIHCKPFLAKGFLFWSHCCFLCMDKNFYAAVAKASVRICILAFLKPRIIISIPPFPESTQSPAPNGWTIYSRREKKGV